MPKIERVFIVYKDADNLWRWTLSGGQFCLAVSTMGYATPAIARASIERFVALFSKAKITTLDRHPVKTRNGSKGIKRGRPRSVSGY